MLAAYLALLAVPALALVRRGDDEFKGNGKPYEDPADKGGRMLTVSTGMAAAACCTGASRLRAGDPRF